MIYHVPIIEYVHKYYRCAQLINYKLLTSQTIPGLYITRFSRIPYTPYFEIQFIITYILLKIKITQGFV